MRRRPAAALLRELDRLSHDGRMRRMVEVGRAASAPDTAALLQDLAGGDVYERRLALQAVYGSQDGRAAATALEDPSAALRGLAAQLLARWGEDDQLLAALRGAPPAARRPLLRRFRMHRRLPAIDAFVDSLAAGDDPDLPRLLPYASPAAVERHLALATSTFGLEDWCRLARLHPDVAAAELLREVEAGAGDDPALTERAGAVLPLLATRRPDAAVALTRALAASSPLSRLPLDALSRRRPDAVAGLLVASEDAAPAVYDLSEVAHRLDRERLEALLTRRFGSLRWTQKWFPRRPIAEREALFRAFGRGFRDELGVVQPWVVGALPRPLREAEGRRHLALPAFAADPLPVLPYAAYLPWDEARAAVDSALRHPDADLRGAALGALAGAVRYHRQRAGEMLALLHQRRREQDPVRQAALEELSRLPPAVWQPEHLEPLSQVLRDALDAADLSPSSARHLEALIVLALPHHPQWAARWLATVVQERGRVSFRDLEHRLSDADVRRIAPALLPVLRGWLARERDAALLGAARSLGRRVRLLPELLDLLEQTVRESRTAGLPERALDLLKEQAPRRLATLIPSLIAADRSWGARPPVYLYLHRRRQDLLGPFLGREIVTGRFSSGRTRFLLPLRGGFFRWTPTQQRRFGDTLREVIEDVQRDSPAVFAAIDALAALPAVPPTTLEALAGPRSRHPAARDTALRALARRETGDGLPALLDAVRPAPPPVAPPDATEAQAIADRAKVATYALRRSLLQMPPTPALAIVREIDTSHLTVAKEVARLLGDLRSEEAFHELLDWERRDDLHRDVRVAVVHAFWGHPDREETWAALQRAAADTEPAVASAAARMPSDRLPPSARRRLLDLLATLLRHPHPAVRLQALQRCATLPVRDDARVLLPPLQAVLRSAQPDLTAAAASAIFGTYAISEPALAGEAIADLRADRRAQRQALEALLNDVQRSPRRLRPAARAALDALAGDPLSGTHQARLAVSAFRGEDLAATLSTLAAREALFADALVSAGSAIERGDAGQEETTLVALERALAGSADAGLRRLALSALIAQSRPPLGWDEARLSRLREYRTDPAPLVAGAATFTLPEAELEP